LCIELSLLGGRGDDTGGPAPSQPLWALVDRSPRSRGSVLAVQFAFEVVFCHAGAEAQHGFGVELADA
jgi:hypothetical protein